MGKQSTLIFESRESWASSSLMHFLFFCRNSNPCMYFLLNRLGIKTVFFSKLKHSLHNKQSTLIFESWESLELLLHWCISLFSSKKTDRQRQRAVPSVLTVTSKLSSESQLSAGKHSQQALYFESQEHLLLVNY